LAPDPKQIGGPAGTQAHRSSGDRQSVPACFLDILSLFSGSALFWVSLWWFLTLLFLGEGMRGRRSWNWVSGVFWASGFWFWGLFRSGILDAECV